MANKTGYVTATPVEKPIGTSPALPKTQAPVQRVTAPKPGSEAELPVQKPGGNAVAMGTAQSPATPSLPKTQAPVQTITAPRPGSEAELPVQKPGGNAQTMDTAQAENGQTASASHSVPDAQGGSSPAYDANTDYQALINEAVQNGDYEKAAYYEQLRNQKIKDLNASGKNQWDAEETDLYSQYLGSGYTSLNSQINGDSDAHYEEVNKLKEFLNQNPSASAYLTQEELLKLAEQYGIDPGLFDSFSQQGGYTQNRDEAIAGGGTGDPVDGFYLDGTWYYYDGTARPVTEGTSGADEQFLSDGSYALVQALKKEWNELNALAQAALEKGDTALYNEYLTQRDQCNIIANQIRNLSGYSGGADGSMYIPNGQLGIDDDEYPYKGGNGPTASGGSNGSSGGSSGGSIGGSAGGSTGGSSGGTGSTAPGAGYDDEYIRDLIESITGGSGDGSDTDLSGLAENAAQDPVERISTEKLEAILNEWRTAAQQQSTGQIDYATQQAITELERALEDAQPQFKEQAESVTLNERQAMDNAALYAALRGDNGGIGQEQYSSIQNAAAQNRLAVQQAQTKLSTDTARQIEDLRAQGEFEKADKALEITQSYLSQLFGLEQWAAENNLNVDQFNAQLKQWEYEYQMALKQLEISSSQWDAEFNAALQQWAQEFAFQHERADVSDEQWRQEFEAAIEQWEKEFAFNQERASVSDSQWQQEFNAALGKSSSGSGGTSDSSDLPVASRDNVRYAAAQAQGMTEEEADEYLGAMVARGELTVEEAAYIFDQMLSFITIDNRNDKYQPVTWG